MSDTNDIKSVEFMCPVVYGVEVLWHDGTSTGKGGFATADIAYEWAMGQVSERRIRENKRFVPKSVTITSSLR